MSFFAPQMREPCPSLPRTGSVAVQSRAETFQLGEAAGQPRRTLLQQEKQLKAQSFAKRSLEIVCICGNGFSLVARAED